MYLDVFILFLFLSFRGTGNVAGRFKLGLLLVNMDLWRYEHKLPCWLYNIPSYLYYIPLIEDICILYRGIHLASMDLEVVSTTSRAGYTTSRSIYIISRLLRIYVYCIIGVYI